MKDLQSENYKTLMMQIENSMKKCKYMISLRLEEKILLTLDILPKTIYRFDSVPIKIP